MLHIVGVCRGLASKPGVHAPWRIDCPCIPNSINFQRARPTLLRIRYPMLIPFLQSERWCVKEERASQGARSALVFIVSPGRPVMSESNTKKAGWKAHKSRSLHQRPQALCTWRPAPGFGSEGPRTPRRSSDCPWPAEGHRLSTRICRGVGQNSTSLSGSERGLSLTHSRHAANSRVYA